MCRILLLTVLFLLAFIDARILKNSDKRSGLQQTDNEDSKEKSIKIGGEEKTLSQCLSIYKDTQGIMASKILTDSEDGPISWIKTVIKELVEAGAVDVVDNDRFVEAVKKAIKVKYEITDVELAAIDYYSGGGYSEINAALRTLSAASLNVKKIRDAIINLDSGMQKLPPTHPGDPPIQLRRLLSFDTVADVNAFITQFSTKTYISKQFESSTYKTEVILPTNKPHKIAILITPSNRRGYYISAVTTARKNEAEVLFLPGTTFITKKDLACRYDIIPLVPAGQKESQTNICLVEVGTDADTVLAINDKLSEIDDP